MAVENLQVKIVLKEAKEKMYVNELSNFLEQTWTSNFRSFQNDINSLVEASHKIVNHLRKSYKINQEKQKSVSKFNSDKKDAKRMQRYALFLKELYFKNDEYQEPCWILTLFRLFLFACYFGRILVFSSLASWSPSSKSFLKKWPCQLSKFLNFFDFSLEIFTDKQEQLYHCLLVSGWG